MVVWRLGSGPTGDVAPVAPAGVPVEVVKAPAEPTVAAVSGATTTVAGAAAQAGTATPNAMPPKAPVHDAAPATHATAPRPATPAPVATAPAAPVVVPAPIAAPPPVAVAAAPVGRGTIHVTGDADKVSLVGAAGRFSPGDVPAGTYAVEAAFGGGALAPAGKVTVEGGGSVTIKCVSDFAKCK